MRRRECRLAVPCCLCWLQLVVILAGCETDPISGGAPGSFGLAAPGQTPAIFAPGVVSLPDRHEFGSVFSTDGRELFFAVEHGSFADIWALTIDADEWSAARRVIGSSDFSANDPMLSPDGSRLYFITTARGNYDIAFIERGAAGGWGEPQFEAAPINSAHDEFYISFTSDRDLVFASDRAPRGDFDIYRAPWSDGGYSSAQRFPEVINTRAYEADAFIDPAGSYLIFSSDRRGGQGRGDLYISFALDDGTWSDAISMGNGINTAGHQLCPFVTNDGQFFFYTSDRDIYWVDAVVIEQSRGRLSP